MTRSAVREPRLAAIEGSLRATTDDDGAPRIEGRAMPYGETITFPNGITETFARGSFTRFLRELDGRPVSLLDRHGKQGGVPVAAVFLEERDDGLYYSGDPLDVPEAGPFMARGRAGLLGSSVEFLPYPGGERTRGNDITVYHARLMGIAGAYSPAYAGATLSARSTEGGNAEMPARARAQADPPEDDDEEATEDAPGAAPASPASPHAGGSHTVVINARELSAEIAGAIRDTLPAARTGSHIEAIRGAELVYTRDSGQSFTRDLVSAFRGDSDARDRQVRHRAALTDMLSQLATRDEASGDRVILWDEVLRERAGEVQLADMGGAIPVDYLPGLLVPRLLKGRPMGGFFQNIGILDARIRTFPKVTTSTTSTVQSGESVNPAVSEFATTAESATPLLRGASTLPSRQVMDSGDPSAAAMIFDDLREAYAQDSETVIATFVAANGNAGTETVDDDDVHAACIAIGVEYMTDYFAPAERIFLAPGLYASLLKQVDDQGRPLVPWAGPTNAAGVQGDAGYGASVLGIPVAMSWASAARKAAVVRSTDFVIYESALAEFTVELDSTVTPAYFKLGCWAYLVPADRRGGNVYTFTT